MVMTAKAGSRCFGRNPCARACIVHQRCAHCACARQVSAPVRNDGFHTLPQAVIVSRGPHLVDHDVETPAQRLAEVKLLLELALHGGQVNEANSATGRIHAV